jgi:NitT/TauT family transport system ATP-binding protein
VDRSLGLAPPAKLEIRKLSISYSSKPRVHAVEEVNLVVLPGETVCLLGPSGCGKSSVLRAIAGFIRPDSGQVLVDGRLVDEPGADRGMVFQEYALFPWLTVSHNIEFGLRNRVADRAERRAVVRSWIEKVKLDGFERAYPKQLSGGMQQRVAVARALAPDPDVLLMDEPFGALDAHTRTRLQNDLLNIWERDRKTVLFVTHSVDEAVFLSDKVVVMTRAPGRIKEIIDIELPRPRRRAELLLDPRYQKYVVEIERMIDDTSEDGLRP